MNRNDKIRLTTIFGGSVLILLVIGARTGWQTWTWLLLVAVLAITVVIGRQIQNQRENENRRARYDQHETIRAQLAESAQHHVTDAPLPSAETDYRFLFSATVHWNSTSDRPGITPSAQQGIAVDSILARARAVSTAYAPEDQVRAQYKLAADLGAARPDLSGHLLAWVDTVALTVSDEDNARLTKLAELRKQERVWEHERGCERNMRAYLGEEVLESPGSAVVWWLARHTDDVQHTVSLLGDLAQLVAAANNTEVDEHFRHLLRPPANGGFPPGTSSSPLSPASASPAEDQQHCSPTHNGAYTPQNDLQHQSYPETILADDVYPHPEDVAQRRLFLRDLAAVVKAHGKPDRAACIRSADPAPTPDDADERPVHDSAETDPHSTTATPTNPQQP